MQYLSDHQDSKLKKGRTTNGDLYNVGIECSLGTLTKEILGSRT